MSFRTTGVTPTGAFVSLQISITSGLLKPSSDLRKDAAFLAKHKAKEAREKDKERIQKTRRIMSGLGSQEGEYKKFLASKKKNRKY